VPFFPNKRNAFPGGGSTLRAAFTLMVSFCMFLLAGPMVSSAQTGGAFRLLSVTVSGSQRFDSPTAAHATGLNVGDTITAKSRDDAANRLASLGDFATVSYRYQTRGESMSVIFTVADASRFVPCIFDNFIWFSPQELKEGLRSRVPLSDGTVPLGGGIVENISAALSALLETRGIHAHVEGSPVQEELGGPVRGVEFQVKDVPMPVRKIEFIGAEKVSPQLLQRAAAPLIDKDYDASFIRNFSREGIAAVYHELGYLRADFGEPVPHLLTGDPIAAAVSVTIPVSEGQPYTLKEIIWSGEGDIPESELTKLIHAKTGSPVNSVALEQDSLALLMLYHPKGYMNADVNLKATLDDSSHVAVYEIQIRQGDLFQVGRIAMKGLDDDQIRSFERLSCLHPGDPFDASCVQTYAQAMMQKLPHGWALTPAALTIHNDTKTVDVTFNFHSN
jgi:outer membrane protein insertion porin family